MASLVLIFLIITVLSLFLWSRRRYYYLTWKLNGIWGIPILGTLIYITNYKKMFSIIEDLMKNRQTPTAIWLPTFAYYADDAETIRKILSSPQCIEKPEQYNGFRDLLGNGILTSNDPKWSKHRKLLNPAFRHQVLLSFIPIFNEEANTFVNRMIKLNKDEPIYLADYLVEMMLDIAMQTTMGKKMNIQNSQSQSFLTSFLYGKKVVAARMLYPWLTSYAIFRISPLYKLQEFGKKTTLDVIKTIINYRLLDHRSSNGLKKNTEDNVNITKSKLSFIEQGIQLVNEKNLLSLDDLVSEANTMIAAGTDTSAATIHNVIMMLAMHPEIQDKVREEVKALLPMQDSDVTYEDVTNMIYTEMVISETLRLLPTVPLIGRNIISDFQVADDIILPKGSGCVINFYHMHRDTKIWGPTANKFDPEHFSAEEMLKRPAYCFSPFALGARGCIGAKLAMISMKIVLARIIRNLRFTTDTKYEDLKFYMEVIIRPDKYPKFKIFKVED